MITLQNASYAYGADALLEGMSLELSQGSFHFLTGPSGAGKSTFLKLLYAELRATSGAVHLFGQDARTMDRDEVAGVRQRIGVVHQDCQFLDHLTIAENVALPLMVQGKRAGADLLDLLAWVGLNDRVNAKPPELSGGERQRAALARAVILSPDVILADEPTGNIDWEMSQKVLQLLVELNRMGKTVMVATHDIALIRAAKPQVASRVLRIQNRHLHLAGADL
ncbi:ATP-binding cassette domain-containing protein [Nereida sp. MMG025]|uniref:cell division ATP-binding protein FtsE n=1 Tax=Nereida sp. MMG025 TaxID=2909981 RepID=UPI00351CD7DC|nr:ATP-binding cassette domain-containing protein [Nereida sp. MMG025]